jgi:hypothetical protein
MFVEGVAGFAGWGAAGSGGSTGSFCQIGPGSELVVGGDAQPTRKALMPSITNERREESTDSPSIGSAEAAGRDDDDESGLDMATRAREMMAIDHDIIVSPAANAPVYPSG